MGQKPLDLTGQRFGKLIARKHGPQRPGYFQGKVTWECDCDCGRTVVYPTYYLRDGLVTSCRLCDELKHTTQLIVVRGS